MGGSFSMFSRLGQLTFTLAQFADINEVALELDGVPGPLAAVAFERAAMKLPIKTKVVARLGDTTHLEG